MFGLNLLIFILFFLVGCNGNLVLVTPAKEISYPKHHFPYIQGFELGTGINFFNTTIQQRIVSQVSDDRDDTMITVGHFNGSTLDGKTTEDSDVFITKTDHNGNVLWSIVLNSLHPMVSDGSGVETATNIVIDQNSQMIYIAGTTTGSLVETNSSGNADLFFAKITTSGSLVWIKQYGEEYGLKEGIDFSHSEFVGDLAFNLQGQLVASFETNGSLFDTNSGEIDGAYDVGLMLVSPVTGEIIKGLQIGVAAAAMWGGDSATSEYTTNANFAFDGKKIVVPFRTRGNLKDINPNTASDAGYFVADENLNLLSLTHLGRSIYNNWSSKGNYAGNVNGDDQFRGVTVNAPGDYLFFGKTTGAMGELNGLADLMFVRFVNEELVSIIQYGRTRSPNWVQNEEPRKMQKTPYGIFCSGHIRSDVLNEGVIRYKPFILKVDHEGVILKDYYLSQNEKVDFGIPETKDVLIQSGRFVVKNGQIRAGFEVSDVTTNGPYHAHLWNIDL